MTERGFTLIELVIGIVLIALAMVIMNTLLISQSKDAQEPLFRVRSSQLGQSIMQNILLRSFDEKSDHNGGRYRCGENDAQDVMILCTSPSNFGPDTSLELNDGHPAYNDVDDFIETDFVNAKEYGDVLGKPLADEYQNYAIKITVENKDPNQTKIINVTIRTPSNEEIVFSALKGNY